MELTAKQAENIRLKLHLIPQKDKEELLLLLDEYEKRQELKKAKHDFLAFIVRVNAQYKIGTHHRHLAKLLQEVANNEKDRVAVSMAPRFGKSLMLSEYFPAWFIGNNPSKSLIIASHTADLAVDFGRKVRNLIDSDAYKEIFPDVKLSADSKSAGRWNTNAGGSFFATGVGGALAGRGADLCLAASTIVEIDDTKVAIQHAQVGDMITTHFGRQKITAKSLTIHDSGLKINSTVTASGEHPFLTPDGWIEAKALQIGDRICTTPFWRKAWTTQSIHLKRLLEKLGKE